MLRELVELQSRNNLETSVLIVGGGLTGLMAGYRLALKDIDVLIIDKNIYLGGDAWFSGYVNMVMSADKRVKRVFDEIGIQYQEDDRGYVLTYTPLVIARLIERAVVCGARFINASTIEDIIASPDGKVRGAVIKWSFPSNRKAAGEIAVGERIIKVGSRFIIDASGFEGDLARIIMSHGLHRIRSIDRSLTNIDNLVEYTQEVVPGLIIAGTAILQYYRVPRRIIIDHGFNILSGERAADLVIRALLEREKRSRFNKEGEELNSQNSIGLKNNYL